MSTIIDVTVECGTQEEIELIGRIVRKTLPNNPVLVHDENVVVKALNPPPNESFLARHWAAEEMAYDIASDKPDLCYDSKRYGKVYYYDAVSHLAQILKKE